jgi:hypothetical protein
VSSKTTSKEREVQHQAVDEVVSAKTDKNQRLSFFESASSSQSLTFLCPFCDSQDRAYMIDACIVRIMKARKTLTHPQLMAQTAEQLIAFKPTAQIIKKRIEVYSGSRATLVYLVTLTIAFSIFLHG